jgi:predicted DNA-binding transcriptional regulator AlpA
MNKSAIITAVATLPDEDERLERIGAILNGKTEHARTGSLRLLRICDCVKESGMSRTSIYRMIEAGTLKPVEIRPGAAPRIREDELRAIVEGRAE